MFDVNQITTTLRGMPDRLLQQYAMMNKGNPYVLSLAVAESNQRKQLRSAAMARNAMPQPKVADAAIAGIAEAPPAVDAMGNVTGMAAGGLPEDQGIGRLPARNIEHMADGGIAGYGDADGGADGGMFNYAQAGSPVLKMAGGGEVKCYGGKGEQLVRTTDGGKSWWLDIPAPSRGNPSVASSLANQKFASREEAIAAYDAVAGGGEAPAPAVTTPAAAAPKIVPYGQTKIPAEVGAAPPPPPAPPAQQGLGAIPIPKTLTTEQAKEQAGQFSDFSDARTALKQAESDQETQGARMRTALSEGLPKTPALQGLEKLLDKQDAETGGEKDKAAGLALLSAGLAIAGGSSRFALQNLKEAVPAVAQYGDALKDIKKMERENMKLRGDIEQARRAEDSNNLKLKLDVEDKIAGRKDKLNEMGINLLAKIADTDTRTATELWTTSAKNATQIQSAVAGAGASANAQLNLFNQLGAAQPGSPLLKGFERYKQEGAEPTMYANYLKFAEDPVSGEAFKKKYPTFAIYKAGMGDTQGQIYNDNNVNPGAVRTR